MPPEVVIVAMLVVVVVVVVLVVVVLVVVVLVVVVVVVVAMVAAVAAAAAVVVVAAARTLLAFPFRFAPRSLAVLPCPSLLSSLSVSAPSCRTPLSRSPLPWWRLAALHVDRDVDARFEHRRALPTASSFFPSLSSSVFAPSWISTDLFEQIPPPLSRRNGETPSRGNSTGPTGAFRAPPPPET